MKPRTRMDLEKVGVIVIGFVLINGFVAMLVHSVLSSAYSLGPTSEYSVGNYFVMSALIGVLAGSLGGLALVRINKQLFRKRSFLVALSITALMYSAVFLIVSSISSYVTAYLTLPDAAFDNIFRKSLELTFNPLTMVIFSMWGIISLITLFFLQVNDKFGPGKLWKFVQGYYFHPREEERVFMFVDLRSSTTIAEKISHKQYFRLLSKLFADITDPILDHEGEIYQYVGDEIVVTWKLNKAIENNNCLECFRSIEAKLEQLAPDFRQEFDVVPELKAGIHHGLVTAGEIGIIKKDIVYSGDVLNTAARIQEQCNNYGVNLLISKETLELFKTTQVQPNQLGEIKLRGRAEPVQLFTI